MIIQFNTDKNISGNEAFRAPFLSLITEELKKFSKHISRIEAHLTDVNGAKEGENDKHFVLEARVEGKHPIAVTCSANTNEEAIEGAIDKLKVELETVIGHLRNH